MELTVDTLLKSVRDFAEHDTMCTCTSCLLFRAVIAVRTIDPSSPDYPMNIVPFTLAQINAERADYGLEPLPVDPTSMLTDALHTADIDNPIQDILLEMLNDPNLDLADVIASIPDDLFRFLRATNAIPDLPSAPPYDLRAEFEAFKPLLDQVQKRCDELNMPYVMLFAFASGEDDYSTSLSCNVDNKREVPLVRAAALCGMGKLDQAIKYLQMLKRFGLADSVARS